MRYAVTGAAEYIGIRVVQELRTAGHEITAVTADPLATEQLAELGVDVVRGEVTSHSCLLTAFDGADAVFHIAHRHHVGDEQTESLWAVNVHGTRNALNAALVSGVDRVVITSSVAANSDTGGRVVDEDYRFTGRHLTTYDRTQAQVLQLAEQYCERGLDVVSVMPGAVYGPGGSGQLADAILKTAAGKRVTAPLNVRFSIAHVDDVAAGHVLAMESGRTGHRYLLTGEQTSLGELLNLVAELSGGKPPRAVPDAMLTAGGAILAAIGWVGVGRMSAEKLRVARATYLGSSTKARTELGWAPRDLNTGLRQMLADEATPTQLAAG